MDEIAAGSKVWHSNNAAKKKAAAPKKEAGPKKPAPKKAAARTKRARKPQKVDPAETPGARKAPLPRKLTPQLATLSEEAPEDSGWLSEIKFDGYRMLAFMESGKVRLLSRNGQDWTGRFKEIATAVAALPASDALVDGEVVVMRPDGTNDFGAAHRA